MGEYDDIIRLPHPVSGKHPRMSLEKRAAQFQPFAALTGFYDAVEETGRQTDEQKVPDADLLELLDERLSVLETTEQGSPEVTVTYFEPDVRKNGGAYVRVSGKLKKADRVRGTLVLEDGTEIRTDRILDIEDQTG